MVLFNYCFIDVQVLPRFMQLFPTLRNAFMSEPPLTDLVPLIIEESNYNRQRKSNWSSYLHLRSTSTCILRHGFSYYSNVRTRSMA